MLYRLRFVRMPVVRFPLPKFVGALAGIAQLVEQLLCKHQAKGSNPLTGPSGVSLLSIPPLCPFLLYRMERTGVSNTPPLTPKCRHSL